ncbi:MAG: hypothetical protein V4496_04300 [Pseudomonadota bacterium]
MHFFDLSRFIVQPIVFEWLDSKALLQFFLTVLGDRSKRRLVDASRVLLRLSELRDETAIECLKLFPAFLETLPEATQEAFFADTVALSSVIEKLEKWMELFSLSVKNRVGILSVILFLKRKCFNGGVSQDMRSGFVCSFSQEQRDVFVDKLMGDLGDRSHPDLVEKAARLFSRTVPFLKQNEEKLYQTLGVIFNRAIDCTLPAEIAIDIFEEAFLYLPASAKARVFDEQETSFFSEINAELSNGALIIARHFKPHVLNDQWSLIFNGLANFFSRKEYEKVLEMLKILSAYPSFEEEFLRKENSSRNEFFTCVENAIYALELKPDSDSDSDPNDDANKNDFAFVEIIAGLIVSIAKVTDEKEELFRKLLLLDSYDPNKLSIIFRMFIRLMSVLNNSERLYLFLELNKILLWDEDLRLYQDMAHAALKEASSDFGDNRSWDMFESLYANMSKKEGKELLSVKRCLIAGAGGVAIAFSIYMLNHNFEKILEHLKKLFKEKNYTVMSASIVTLLKSSEFKAYFLSSDFLFFIMSEVDSLDYTWGDRYDEDGVQYDSAWLRLPVIIERIIDNRACVEKILSSRLYQDAGNYENFSEDHMIFGWYITRQLPYFFSRKENVDFVSVFIEDRKNLLKMIMTFYRFDWKTFFYELSKNLPQNDVDDLICYASSVLDELSEFNVLKVDDNYGKLICLYILPAHIERHFDLWERLLSICANVNTDMRYRAKVFTVLVACVKFCAISNVERLTRGMLHIVNDAFFDILIELLSPNISWELDGCLSVRDSVLSLLQSFAYYLPPDSFNERMKEHDRLIDEFFRIIKDQRVESQDYEYKAVMDLFTRWIVQGFDLRSHLDRVELIDTAPGRILDMFQEAWELNQAPNPSNVLGASN